MAISLFNTDNITDATNMDYPQGVQSLTLGGVTYLYVTGETSDSIAVYRLDAATGTPTLVDTVFDSDDPALFLNGLYEITAIEANGTAYVLAGGFLDSGLSVFEVQADGTLVNIQNIADDGTLELFSNYGKAATLTVGGTTYVYWPGNSDDGISAFRVEADGTLTNIGNVTDDATLKLNGIRHIEAVSIGGRHFLITAAEQDQGLSVIEIGSDGGFLDNPFNIDDASDPALILSGAEDVAVVQTGGVTWVYATGLGDNGISIFRMNPDGTLTLDDTLADGGTLELFGAFELEAREIGGTFYLLASGLFDYGFTLFRVDGDGGLTELQSVTDDDTLNLGLHGGATIVELDGVPYIYATGRYDNGFSVFRVDMPIAISYQGETVEMAETLAGAVGMAPAGGRVQVVNPALYDTGPEDVQVSVDNLTVDLDTLDTFNTGRIPTFHLGGFAYQFTVEGGSNADVRVFGTAARGENIATGGGFDTVYSSGGDDTVSGGGGVDALFLGFGDDSGQGGGASDSLFGQQGADTLRGGAGGDTLMGGADGDVVIGGGASDSLVGGSGYDTLAGGKGQDTLEGNTGNDLLEGGAKSDTLSGDKGNDTLTGGGGPDTFVFAIGDGNDRVTDFRDDVDGLDFDLAGLGYADGAALIAGVGGFTNGQGHAVLDFGGDRVVIENTDVSLLADDIF